MAEKLGKILKESEQQSDSITSAPQEQQPMPQQVYPQPQGYPPQYPPQNYQQPPQAYPPQNYQQPSPVWNNGYPYNQTPQFPPNPNTPVMKPAIGGELFKMEKVTSGNKDFVVLSVAIDEKLAKFGLGKVMVVTQ